MPALKSPCYAVIFSSRRKEGDAGYAAAAEEVARLAQAAPGFLGAESVRQPDGQGVTVSYWESLEAIARFRDEPGHVRARLRLAEWYDAYSLRVCRVERQSDWQAEP